MANKFHYGNGYNSMNSIAIIWSIDDVRDQLEILNEDMLTVWTFYKEL